MKAKAFLPAGVAVMALLVSLVPLAAAHDGDEEISATGFLIGAPLIVDAILPEEDSCVILGRILDFGLSGTLDGLASTDLVLEFGTPCSEPLSAPSCEGDGSFAGTVAGVPGFFDFELEGDNCDEAFQLEIEDGSGGLEDLDGTLSFVSTGDLIIPYAYSGQLELDD